MRKLIFFSLYFSEGAPIGFIWWALPAILTAQGFNLTQIATLSAVATIPWSFKFLFAPMVDLISMNYLSLKKQLFIYQLIMGVALIYLPESILSSNLSTITTFILIHGIFAALQDICIDALAIKSIPKDEIGRMNGIMQAGMLVGRSIFGGAGVYIAAKFGLSMMVYFLISSIWISLIILQKSKLNTPPTAKKTVSKYAKDFYGLVRKKSFWMLIVITFFAGFSYNGISTIAGAILTQLGASSSLYGITYSLFIPISMACGALIGGNLSDKELRNRTLKTSLLLSILSAILVGLMVDHFISLSVLIGSYVIFYFFVGTTTSSLYGFLMKNTSKEFAALEFSIFMGVVNLCDSSTSYITGQLVQSYSYTMSAFIIGVICMVSLLTLVRFERSQFVAIPS